MLGRNIRGARGCLAFADLPPGNYALDVEADGHLPAISMLKIEGGSIEMTVLLDRASWIVVRLDGRAFAEEGYELAAVALAGPDPGWTLRALDGGRPVILDRQYPRDGAPEFRLNTRPGRYRIRIEVARSWTELRDPPRATGEFDIEVPPAGEVAVDLPAP